MLSSATTTRDGASDEAREDEAEKSEQSVPASDEWEPWCFSSNFIPTVWRTVGQHFYRMGFFSPNVIFAVDAKLLLMQVILTKK